VQVSYRYTNYIDFLNTPLDEHIANLSILHKDKKLRDYFSDGYEILKELAEKFASGKPFSKNDRDLLNDYLRQVLYRQEFISIGLPDEKSVIPLEKLRLRQMRDTPRSLNMLFTMTGLLESIEKFSEHVSDYPEKRKRLGQCVECKKFFDTYHLSREKKFCSKSCKSRFYYKRKNS